MDTRAIAQPKKADRRYFLKKISIGGAGLALSALSASGESSAALFGSDKSDVSLIKNTDRREATIQSLTPFQKIVEKAIGDKQVVIKVNAGLATPEYAKNSTHADSIRGILDFLKPIHDRQVIIAEGIGGAKISAFIGFENYGYMPLEKEYNTKIIDANDQSYSQRWIRAAKHHPQAINIIDMYMDPDVYLISAARMKTHNAVVGTYSLKNVVMGAPMCHYNKRNQVNEKFMMHGGTGSSGGRELSYNLFLVAQMGVQPDLAVIDGVESIEGDGPWGGSIVEHGIVVSSTDFVAADRLCSDLMGIDPNYMKYLEFCSNAGMGNFDMDNIKVIGEKNYKDLIINYKMHSQVEEQVAWIHENFQQ